MTTEQEYRQVIEKLKLEANLGDGNRVGVFTEWANIGDNWYALSALPYAERLLGKKLVYLCYGTSTPTVAEEFAAYLSHGDVEIETHRITVDDASVIRNTADRQIILRYRHVLYYVMRDVEIREILSNFNVSCKQLLSPQFPPFDADFYREKYKITQGKAFFIVPRADAVTPLPLCFWNFCAEIFRCLGYEPIFNVSDGAAKMYNGKNAFIPLKDAVGFANLCGNVFGMRTGLFDLLSSSTANMTIFSTEHFMPIDEVYNIDNSAGRIKTVWLKSDIEYETFLPMNFIRQYVETIVSGYRAQIKTQAHVIADKIPLERKFKDAKLKGHPHSKAGNKVLKRREIQPFCSARYAFYAEDIYLFFEAELFSADLKDLKELRVNIVLKSGSGAVQRLEDCDCLSAVFKPEFPGEYAVEVALTDRKTFSESVFVTDSISYRTEKPKEIAALKNCVFFESYVDALVEFKESLLILIVACDAHTDFTSNERTKKLLRLKNLGIQTDMEITFRHSFLCVIDRGDIVTELCDERKELTYGYALGGGINIKLTSMGFNVKRSPDCSSTVEINGNQCAVNKRGLNFVVYDKAKNEIIDSVCFDTFANGAASR
jgi:hypothetical protein